MRLNFALFHIKILIYLFIIYYLILLIANMYLYINLINT